MAEGSPPSSVAAPDGMARGGGFELRLEHARAFVSLTDRPVVPGLKLAELAMEVPDVRFPFDVGKGAAQFRKRLCDLARVELAVEPEFLSGVAAGLDFAAAGIASLQLVLRGGFAEAGGRLEGGVPFTCKLGLEPQGERALALVVYEARLYRHSALPAAALPSLLARAAAGVARQEGSALLVDPLGLLLRRVIPSRGWKLPRAAAVRLARLAASPGALRIGWDRGHTGPAEAPSEPDRLAALEGSRAFREAEALVARGEWDAAREAYLAAGAAASSHPFAASRLLSLFAAEERFHDEALDLSAHWLARRTDFAPALLAEGVLRAHRGERPRSARAFAELATVSARRGEELGALAAADACFALGHDAEPAALARAVEVALGLRRDHLPALRALTALAQRTGDREALLRASRRLAAYAADDAEKAAAHARLAEMLLEADPPSARLHLDQALRLAPGDAAALAALARACEQAGEWLRAARAHDQLRELHLARGDTEAAAQSALAVGSLWEERLGHPENALLRYREACDLSASSGEARERAGRTADSLGHWAEAADHYAGLLASLDPRQPGAAERAARAHRALARTAETRLSDPPRAASHLEAAVALQPNEPASLERLAALYRAMGRPAELLGALDRLAPLTAAPSARAALLGEAGDACLGALGLPDAARSRYAAALSLDPQCRPALEGMGRIARDRGDAQAEREVLSRLVLVARDRAEEALLYDRLAAACERAGDLPAAARGAASARRAEPSLERLREAVRIARLAADGQTLGDLLAELGGAARAAGDAPAAVAAWIERASLLGASLPPLALAALSEARAIAPGDPLVLRAQADLAEKAGEWLTALSALRALLVSGPPDAAALELRAARAARSSGDSRAARQHAERALAAAAPGAADLLGDILETSDDFDTRAALLERSGRFLEAARLWERAGQPERLRAALEQASVDPTAPDEVLERLADARLSAGDRAAAAQAMARLAARRQGSERARLVRRAGELDPDSPLALRLQLMPEAEPRPTPAERADLLSRLAALPAVPPEEAARALVERARLLDAGQAPGGPAAALAAARAAAARAPPLAEAIDLLAELATRAGDPATAARALLDGAGLARDAGDPDAAQRLAAGGHAALAAGLAEEGEEALSSALRLGLVREEAGPAWSALADRARARGDSASERAALGALVSLVPTGQRPARLLRLAALQLEAGDLGESRASAEEARALAPRDLPAVEACLSAAERQGDLPAVAALLAEAAALDPDRAGDRLLERARLLAGPVGDPVAADQTYGEALARLPPRASLSTEHARLRREAPPLRDLPWGEPLERMAQRVEDPRVAAQAWRDAAFLGLAQEDHAAALRAARKAFARSREEPALAGPLLARVLYLRGGGAEALVLHRGLLEAGFPGIDEGDAAVLCRQLAELAEDAGELGLAVAALDRLLQLRPHDLEAAEWRFRLDPDRRQAVRALADAAGGTRSARRRVRALALAADAAHRELADPALADALWRRARQGAADYPTLLAELESVRLEAARREHDPEATQEPAELLEALHDAAQAWQAAGDPAAARALLEEAAELYRRHGRLGDVEADLRRLEELAAAQGDAAGAGGYARGAGRLLRERGDRAGAEQAHRRAVGHDRGDIESWQALEAAALEQGEAGAPLLAEVIAAQAEREKGLARAEALTGLARLLAGPLGEPERALQALRGALEAAPGFEPASADLERLLRALGKGAELARLLLARAAGTEEPADRAALRREAAEALEAEPDGESRALAAEALAAAAADAPGDAGLARSLARLLVSLGRREEAIPHLAAAVRADPDDEASAQQLAAAYSGRHRDRASLHLERAGAAAGAARAARLREAAKALFAAGDDVRARALLREAFDAWPADDGAFLAAIRDAAADIDRLDGVLSARAAAVPAEAAGCHRARADALLAFGRVEDALRAYQACLAVAPEDAGALSAVAEIRAQAGGDEAAAEADARLLALADAARGAVPETAEARARYRTGLSAWARGHPDEGIAHLARALALSPGDERAGLAWAALASGYAARGDRAGALEAARRRADRAADLGLGAERREALEAGAALAAQLGDQGADAASILEALLALRLADAPGLEPAVEALLGRAAAALLREGENARAEALIALAARRAEGHRRAELLSRLADAAQARGDRAAAQAARTGAFEAEPAASSRARLEEIERSGDTGALAVALERSLAAGDGDPADLTLRLARARSVLGDPWGAIRAWESLVAMGPEAAGYREAVREVEAHHQRSGDARALAADQARRAQAAESPGERARHWLGAAQILERASASPEEVRASLERACEADPDEAQSWRSLAEFESRRGDSLPAARAHLAVAIRTEGAEAARAALEAARVFDAIGRPNDAARAHGAALHAAPGSWPSRRALAARALERGDPAAAADHLAEVDPADVPAADRLEFLRAQAHAFTAAGREGEALAGWRRVFQADPGDEEAFDNLARPGPARAGGSPEAWIELAARHDAALATSGHAARRRDLRCERARVFEEMGRLEAAEGAWRAALEIDPSFGPAREALASLGRRGDTPGLPPARPPQAEAAPSGPGLPQPVAPAPWTGAGPAPDRPADPVAEVLRAQVEAARGDERVELLERLAGHLERGGDHPGAAAALAGALEIDPGRELTFAWFLSLAEGDRALLERAYRLRAAGSADEPSRAAALGDLGIFLAGEASSRAEARAVLTQALAFDPGNLAAGEALARLGAEPEPAVEPPPPAGEPQPLPPLDLATAFEAALELEPAADAWPDQPPAAPAEPAVSEAAPAEPMVSEAAPAEPAVFAPAQVETRAAAPEAASAAEGEEAREEPLVVPEPGDAARRLHAHGRARAAAGDNEAAYQLLSQARALDPASLEVAADLASAAGSLGRLEEWVALSEFCADALGVGDPVGAAGRYRACAAVARDRLGDAQRAAALLEKAVSLWPGDEEARRELTALLARKEETAHRALDDYLGRARLDPSDLEALAAIGSICRQLAAEDPDPARSGWLLERARAAEGVARFVSPGFPAVESPPAAPRVTPEARARAAVPGAEGPVGRLLAQLAPWLEPLFPADLSRHGVGAGDRVGPSNQPALHGRVESVARALEARPLAVFLAPGGTCQVAVENTQPPALVVGGAALDLEEGALAFLLARAVALCGAGWALLGKFAPKDVLILGELASRFAGAEPPPLGLPAPRAGAFLAALEKAVPPDVRSWVKPLGAASAEELRAFDPRAFTAALRRTASRVALLHTGDVHGALLALSRLDEATAREAGQPTRALGTSDLRDVALFALSDPYLELRRLLVG